MKITGKLIAVLALLLAAVPPAQAKGLKLKFETALYSDDKGGQINLPEGLDCGADYLVVADTGNRRLLRYAIGDKTIGFKAEIALPKTYPLQVHLDSAGNILVLDGKERRILRLAPDGTEQGYLEPANLPDQNTVVPKGFVLDREDNLYLLDIFSARVLKLDKSGKFLLQIPFPKPKGFISALALTPQGGILLLDSVAGTLYKAAPDAASFSVLAENLKEYTNFPNQLTTDAQGNIYLVDQYGSGLAILGADGSFQGRQSSMGWGESLLRYPSQACSSGGNQLFVADRNNNRVQLFTVTEN